MTIGNDALSRTLSITDGKLATTEINNKRAKTSFVPEAGSSEFILKTTKDDSGTSRPAHPALDRDGWSAEADTEETAGETSSNSGPAAKLLDGDASTYWHTAYQSSPATNLPNWVIFDLKSSKTFQCFSYTPRPQEDANGNIKGYELYVSNAEAKPADQESWGQAVATGEFSYDGTDPIYVNLDEQQTARWVKLVATSSKNGGQFAAGAEFNLHESTYNAPKNTLSFSSSDLTLNGTPAVTDTTATINGVEKTGKKVSFAFAPYTHKDVSYTITEHIVMYNGDHFMRKYLDISVPKSQAENAEIDYIDLESLNVPENAFQWTIPRDKGGVVEMEEFKANLGQPIYIQGMFLGCEFPVTDTEIVDNNGYIRYYSGKDFNRLVTDSQANDDGTNITYPTWQTVVGAARSADNSVIQSELDNHVERNAKLTGIFKQVDGCMPPDCLKRAC